MSNFLAANDYKAENITFMICIAVVLTAITIGIFFGKPCIKDDDDDVSDSTDTP